MVLDPQSKLDYLETLLKVLQNGTKIERNTDTPHLSMKIQPNQFYYNDMDFIVEFPIYFPHNNFSVVLKQAQQYQKSLALKYAKKKSIRGRNITLAAGRRTF